MAKVRTAKQKAALRKAQLASARKRRRRRAAKAGVAVAVGGAMTYGAYKAYSTDYRGTRQRVNKAGSKNPYLRRKITEREKARARARLAAKKAARAKKAKRARKAA
jgi:hypothetical protein